MQTVPDGYWYCPACKATIAEQNLRDVTFDGVLVEYLRVGTLPAEDSDRDRVVAAAKFLRWGPDTLQIKTKYDWVDVPPVAVRLEIVEERHILLRHAGVSKLMPSLKGDFYWHGMLEDVTTVLKRCDNC